MYMAVHIFAIFNFTEYEGLEIKMMSIFCTIFLLKFPGAYLQNFPLGRFGILHMYISVIL